MTARSRTPRAPAAPGRAPSSFPAEPAPAAAVLPDRTPPAGAPDRTAAAGDLDRWLAESLLAVTDTTADGFDLAHHLAGAAGRFARLLGGGGVAVVVAGEDPRDRWTVAATSPAVRCFATVDERWGTGPATEAVRHGQAAAVAVAGERASRWTGVAPVLRLARVAAVHAEPFRHRDGVVGAMVAYRGVARPLDATVVEALRILSDGVAVGVAQARTVARARRLAEQLQGALSSRVAIEQAKGVLAARLALPVEDAFSLMRRHARDHRRRLDSVARDVVHGTVAPTALRPAG